MIPINHTDNINAILNSFHKNVISTYVTKLKKISPNKLKDIDKNFSLLKTDINKSIDGNLIENIPSIYVAKPNELRKYINYFDTNFKEEFFHLKKLKNYKTDYIKLSKKKKKSDEEKTQFEELKNLVKQCNLLNDFLKIYFSYSSYDQWKAYELAEKLSNLSDIKVCPYCNRNYISVYSQQHENGCTRMKFDHYYDKATYPYLALSFYNLIPSCNVCNSDLKGAKNFYEKIHIHPYEDKIDNLKFKLKIEDVSFINSISKDYEIDLNFDDFNNQPDLKLKVENHNETFKIKKLYNFHKDITNDIINKFYVYNEERINEIYNSFDGKLFNSENEVKAMIFGPLLSDNIRPFSKLTEDIIEDLVLKNKFIDEI
ncbi:hypothetical protein [Empedobacter sp.]|uniref:hypothetical protein n=1 Tax=Empedobacter sp. TaxID=1927715 RepID=UPI0028983E42|nr:hypothetical protein [Empedobacter sp.]